MNDLADAELTRQSMSVQEAIREWTALIRDTEHEIKAFVRAVVADNKADLRARYSRYLENDPDIAAVIDTEHNREAFVESFLLWFEGLLASEQDIEAPETFARKQAYVGSMMARIGLPPHALSRAMRKTTLWCLLCFERAESSRAMLVKACRYIVSLIDITVEIREVGYHSNVTSLTRLGEVYRLSALSHNLAMEKERQRAALMEWSHHLLMAFHREATTTDLPPLGKSEFGLWLTHKAPFLFEPGSPFQVITVAVDRIDGELVPALARTTYGERDAVGHLIQRIEEELAALKFALNSLFDTHLAVENGRDPLTRLLNRRFIPSVLMHEIALQKGRSVSRLSVLLIDLDRFKDINDAHGHKGGDTALQHAAHVISDAVRSSDFVFRYGGEEFAVVLVDCDAEEALRAAQRIRDDMADSSVDLPEGGKVRLTASIGLATFRGELDYETLIERADRAMYEAKAQGRDRVVVAA